MVFNAQNLLWHSDSVIAINIYSYVWPYKVKSLHEVQHYSISDSLYNISKKPSIKISAATQGDKKKSKTYPKNFRKQSLKVDIYGSQLL